MIDEALNFIAKVIAIFRVMTEVTVKTTIQVLVPSLCRLGLHRGVCYISLFSDVIEYL